MLALKPLSHPKSFYCPPRPRRLPRSRKVTIAAGFVCQDGIVLCADTQEVIPGFTKNETEKIKVWKDGGFSIAITGSGETEGIEVAAQLIEDALTEEYSKDEPLNCLGIIQTAVRKFFDTSIRPYASFPRDDRPFVDLLIAVGVSNKATQYESLFKATGVTVREIHPGAECIGTGQMIAKGRLSASMSRSCSWMTLF